MALSWTAACKNGDDAAAPLKPATPPNVVLITLESLRPQNLSVYGYEKSTTPVLEELAKEAVTFEDAHAVTSWTLTSHASIFTGFWPTAHRVLLPRDPLDDSYTTIAEALKQRGYQTAAYVSGPFLKQNYNLDQGFDIYDDTPSKLTHVEAHGDVTNPAIEAGFTRFLQQQRQPTSPFFLFLYVWDPHYDYIPPPPYDAKFVTPDAKFVEVRNYIRTPHVHKDMDPKQLDYVVAQYDGEILWTDTMIGRLRTMLQGMKQWDNTLFIVTSDHGEEFFEHGDKGHKNNIYAESMHVPLLIKPPGKITGRRDGRLASLIDIYPTIMNATASASPHPTLGRDLLKPDPSSQRPVFGELTSTWYRRTPQNPQPQLFSERWASVRLGDLRLIGQPEKDKWELFNVRQDPGELKPLGAERVADVQRLRGVLAEYDASMKQLAQGFQQAGQIQLTPEFIKRLQSLGYINAPTSSPPPNTGGSGAGP